MTEILSLEQCYITALSYALKRQIESDQFVVKSTCARIKKHIDTNLIRDPAVLGELRFLISEFLDSERVTGCELQALFNKAAPTENYSTLLANLKLLRGLSEHIEKAQKKIL